MDELTTGLDTRARRDVWRSLSDLKAKGLTILLTSHFMDEVEALCDKIMILKTGKASFMELCRKPFQPVLMKNWRMPISGIRTGRKKRMKAFSTLLKTELKLSLRGMDMFILPFACLL